MAKVSLLFNMAVFVSISLAYEHMPDEPRGLRVQKTFGCSHDIWNRIISSKLADNEELDPSTNPIRPTSLTKTNPPESTPVTTFPTSTQNSQTTSDSRAATLTPKQLTCVQKCPSTREYNPVCGSNKVTYTNPGRLACSAKCGNAVKQVRTGKCAGSDTPCMFC